MAKWEYGLLTWVIEGKFVRPVVVFAGGREMPFQQYEYIRKDLARVEVANALGANGFEMFVVTEQERDLHEQNIVSYWFRREVDPGGRLPDGL